MTGMDDNFSFGYWLRRQRLARDLRQDDLAAQLGIATVSLRKLEADERRPSLQLIARVAEVFALSDVERATLQRVARADLSPAALPLPARAPDADPQGASGHTPDLPTGTVTFLFTDIEGSTQRWEQHPALMRANLARHDTLLRTAITEQSGVVVKGTGDGLIAAFAQAADGLAAALASQRALLAADWGAAGPLRVRMALHSGEAQLVDGDYFGPTLNRTARLLAAGHGGQVLLSLAAAELLRDRLPAGVQLRDLGAHQLKDLARPEQIVQVVAPDLPSDFPPLRTRDTRLRLLPTPPNPLIGREAELTQIAALLGDPTVRLLTLLGPGGTGKTRLSIQAAQELGDHFADGVCFIDLTPVRDPALVLPTIGHTLGLQESQGQAMTDTVTAFLRAKALLLVLDNCEQVIDAAPAIAALLAAAPQLRVLATSRAALRIAAEQLYPVPPLTVPAVGDTSLAAPAAQLFLARARAGRGELVLSGDAGAAVAAICRRLDGLPLALELAAARLRHLTPQALLARLEHPLALLTSGARDLPTRQQTLRATIAWSYDLLSEPEQTLFRRLGVFVGGWDLAAAEVVGDLGVDTLDLLSELIDQSLIGQAVGVGDEPRYTMLETIREYALEQLAACGEAEATGARHAGHFLNLAERARPEEFGPRATFWLDRLEEEHANLRTVLSVSQAHQRYEQLARLCTALRWFWFYRAHIAEAVFWLDLAGAHQAQLSPLTRARVLLDYAYYLPDHRRRFALIEQSLRLFRKLGDRRELAWALTTVSGMSYFYGDEEFARQPAEECLPLARTLGEPVLLADALQSLGQVRTFDGVFDDARQLFEEALGINRALGDQQAISYNLNALGELALLLSDYPQAEACFSESARLRRLYGDRRGMAAHLINLSDAVRLQGDLTRALGVLYESLSVFSEIGWAQGIGWVHLSLIKIANKLGQYQQSARFLGVEEAIRIAVGYTNSTVYRTEEEQAQVEARAGLSADVFAAAWAAGRALRVEAATDEALAWLTAAQYRLGAANAPEVHQAEE